MPTVGCVRLQTKILAPAAHQSSQIWSGRDEAASEPWGHDDDELRTWEPLEQLVEDVPVLIEKYVCEDGHQQLVTAHRQAVKLAKKKLRHKQL